MPSVRNKYAPRNWRNKGYEDISLKHVILPSKQSVVTPKSDAVHTERQQLKAVIGAMKSTRQPIGGFKSIRAAKQAFNAKFGRRK